MKVKKFSVIVLFIMVLVSGCSPTATRVIWNFEADGVFSFFPMSFYKIVNDNPDRLSWYLISYESEECNVCKEEMSSLYNYLITTDDNGLLLNVMEKKNTCITDPRKFDSDRVKDLGDYPIEITEDDKVKVISDGIDEEKRKVFESTPLLTEGLVLNKDYIKNNLTRTDTENRYLDSVTYAIKNPETDPNNLYLKSKLGVSCEFTNITLKYDKRQGEAIFGIYTENGLSVRVHFWAP